MLDATNLKEGRIIVDDVILSILLSEKDFLTTKVGSEAKLFWNFKGYSMYRLGKKILFDTVFEVRITFINGLISYIQLSNPNSVDWPEQNDPNEVKFKNDCLSLIRSIFEKEPPIQFSSGNIDVAFEPKNNFYYILIQYSNSYTEPAIL